MLILRNAQPLGKVAERVHTQYDSNLGWVNKSNFFVNDMYGPGIYIKTNARGFRNSSEHSITVEEGIIRVVCSGDSFTLGYGVNNEETWPAAFSRFDERFETINMGQGGYGVDQSYLWYKRDGIALDHQIHLFAFITGDFDRMRYSDFKGYPKPMLKADIDENNAASRTLVVENVPVSRLPYIIPKLFRYRNSIEALKTIQLLKPLIPSLGIQKGPLPFKDDSKDDVFDASRLLFSDLKTISKQKNILFVAIWLPVGTDYERKPHEDEFRKQMIVMLGKLGINVIDLIPLFRRNVHESQVDELFIGHDYSGYTGSRGHYSVKGNQFFAKTIYEELLKIDVATGVSSEL